METYDNLDIIKKLQRLGISLFTLADFGRLFKIDNQQTVYKKIQRLEKRGFIKKLIKGRYLSLMKHPNDFSIANFLYQPSYISLESALSFYGVIAGFPYQITSITPRKPKTIVIEGKEFSYSRINSKLFFGFEKKEGFLMAEKEKAIFDFLYFAGKGLRNSDFDEWELADINKKKLEKYCSQTKNKKLLKIFKKLPL